MKKVLVTGACGMLGQDLCPALEKEGYTVIKTDVSDMNITIKDEVKKVLTEQKPDIVIHCAAYTNVDKAEEDYDNAYNINVMGTENVAEVCSEINAVIVYFSTDYVFDGKGTRPYIPSDKVNPINNYGLTKQKGEEAVKKYCKKYFIARTSWLYGIHGKNFVETMISLAAKPELKVVDDQIGCPTWTMELIGGILKIIKTEAYGTYHICGGNSTSWYGFAKEIFKLADLKVNLIPCTTEEFPRPAKRPHYSIMDNKGICRDWKNALKDYMELRK